MPSASSYWLSQSARVGWFLGQYLLSSRLRRRWAGSRPGQARVRTPEKKEDRRRRSPSCSMTFVSCCAGTGATFGTASIACRAAPPTARGGSLPTRWRSLRTSRRWTNAPSPRLRRRQAHARDRPLRLSRLLPAQLPLSDRRLSQRAVGKALRPAGRGAVHRQRRCDAPPGTGGASALTYDAGAAFRSPTWTSPAAPAASWPACSIISRNSGASASISAPIISRKPVGGQATQPP